MDEDTSDLATIDKVTSDDPSWDRSCSPTPWLLPPNTELPYSGMHNGLQQLAETQAREIDGYKAVSVVFFNYHQSVLLQNSLYSMIKWSGVCNYIVAVWDEPSLEVCQAMNLPCFNATAMTPGNEAIGVKKEARLHSPDYVRITWMKPILVSALVDLGFLVHASDVDIAYAPADLTKSYLNFILQANATAAFQYENHAPSIINTGNYMILPNEQGKTFMKNWLGQQDKAIDAGMHEQHALGKMWYNSKKTAFTLCSKPEECLEAAGQGENKVPIVRRTQNSWYLAYGNTCITKTPHLMHAAHPCSFPYLYFHSVCVAGSFAKSQALKGAGFWFLDDGEDGKGCLPDEDNPNVVRCRPLVEKIPEMEDDFSQCDATRLAFNFFASKKSATAVDPSLYSANAPVKKQERRQMRERRLRRSRLLLGY